MADKELGKLSPEQIQKLAKTTSELKDFPSQQEELIGKILAGEIKIGNTRIASLEQYFDIYSKNLDLIARKYSTLNDAFLILGKELNEDFKQLSSDIEKLNFSHFVASKNGDGKSESGKDDSSTRSGRKAKTDSSSVYDTIDHEKRSKLKELRLTDTITKLREERLSQLKRLQRDHEDALDALTLERSKKREDLILRSKVFQIQELTEVTNAELEAQKLANKLDIQLEYASTKSGATDLGDMRARKVKAEEEEKSLQELKKQLDAKRLQLEYEARAAHNGRLLKKDAAEIEKQLSTEFKKKKDNLDRLTAERFAKERLLAEAGISESFEKRRIERKRELELALMLQNNGIVTKEELLAIEETVDKEFALRSAKGKKLIAELGEERLYQAKLASVDTKLTDYAKNDPSLSAELDAKIKKDIADLEYQYRLEHNNQLDEQARKNIVLQVKTRYAEESSAIDALAKEYTDKLKVDHFKGIDPELAAAYDAERTERKRKLELEAVLRNNGIITEEDRKRIDTTLQEEFDAKFSLESDLLNKLRDRRLKDAELLALKEKDPVLAAATEAKIRQEILEQEYLYRKAHNDELDADARKEIEYQAKLKYLQNQEAAKELVRLERLKEVDPGLTQKRADKVAKLKADLEYQYMFENEGKITEEALKNIKEQAEAKYTLESEAMQRLAKLRLQEETENRYKEANPEAGAALEARRAKLVAEEERKIRQKTKSLISKEDHEALVEKYKEDFTLSKQNMEKLAALQSREDKKKKRADVAQTDQQIAHAVQLGGFSKEDNLLSRMESLIDVVQSADEGEEGKAALAVAIKAISSLVAQLEDKIDSIGSYKGDIDTRLQGSKNETVLGSYWDQLNRDMMKVGAVTPYFKQEDFANNIKSLVDRGIAFDLKQRAFLMTIQEKIANTFEVADGTLLRLIRLQQEDSTAGRLGMESALNSFLNEMYENTEYLKGVANSVRGSLEEMEALMTGAAATEVEYQVQKWMGSLYSVGMSQDAVQKIASALGQLAAGQVDALSNGGAGNLLVMAANDAGIPIADILSKGVTADETNKLLQATVNYLADIANSTKGNNVVQQQLANVFGVKASDLRAATNLATNNTVQSITSKSLTYDNMLYQLQQMANTMGARTSIGEMMTNVWDNGMYTLASSMANNPVSYLLYKMSSLLEDTTGGISIPAISAAGFGVDLETTVADLMRVASLSTGVLGSIGSMVTGLASSFSGQAMLNTMGIKSGSGLQVLQRGGGVSAQEDSSSANRQKRLQSTSSSGYVGNASSSDIKSATLQEAEDTKKQLMIEAKEEAETTQIDFINTNVLKIYELLDEVTSGKRNFMVKVAGYGLTKLSGDNTALSNAQGGVAGLLSNNAANTTNGNALNGGFSSGNTSSSSGYASSYNNSSYGSSSGSVAGSANNNNSGNNGGTFGLGSGVDLGGWTVT